MERNKFIFYKDWWDALRQMPEDMSRAIIEAIMNYALYGIDTDDPQIAYSIYALAKGQIDRDAAKYDERAERSRINGAKSKGAPIGNQNARKQPKQPNGLKTTQNNPDNPKQPKQPNNINININSNSNKESSKDDSSIDSIPKQPKAEFIAPSVDEVSRYAASKGYSVNAETFVSFYESKGWMIGRNRMRNWKAAVTTWATSDRGRSSTPQPTAKPAPAAPDYTYRGFGGLDT